MRMKYKRKKERGESLRVRKANSGESRNDEKQPICVAVGRSVFATHSQLTGGRGTHGK